MCKQALPFNWAAATLLFLFIDIVAHIITMPLRQVPHQVRQLPHHFDHPEKVLMDSLGALLISWVLADNWESIRLFYLAR